MIGYFSYVCKWDVVVIGLVYRSRRDFGKGSGFRCGVSLSRFYMVFENFVGIERFFRMTGWRRFIGLVECFSFYRS